MQSEWRRTLKAGKIALVIVSFANSVAAMPNNGTVISGAAGVTNDGKNMSIQQLSDKLIMNWQDFSVGSGQKVIFLQPSINAVSLNRVTGNNPSAIFGQLLANGKVFLINPNGILFAPGASVNTGGLIASTLNISNEDFLAGRYIFTNGTAKILNQGEIATGNGGYIVLLAPQIINEGTITADKGSVALGAGQQVTLDLKGDGLLKVSVDKAALQAEINNKSLIKASGGQVLLQAKSLDSLLAYAVNHSGIIEADSIEGLRGTVTLDAGNGAAKVSGKISAAGQQVNQAGGTVQILGNMVNLLDGASLDVSGQTGGGTILAGGNFHGKGLERNAAQTTIGPNAILKADALSSGNGGNVVIWADDTTLYQGTISAKGGAVFGDGGQVEVSGKKVLNYQGTTDLRATNGKNGSLLLDPNNIYITSGGGSVSGISFGTNTGSDSTISGANLSSALNTANVILQADNDIQISDNITVTTPNNGLTLQAGRSIVIDNGAKVATNHGDFKATINDEGADPAHRAIGSAQFQMKDGSQIDTTGGSITINSGTFGGSQDGYVLLGGGSGNVVVDASGGNIAINGITASGADKGIAITNSSQVTTSGTGTITLVGTGKSGGNNSSGLSITSGSIVAVQDGDLLITGQSRGTGNNNTGIEVDGGANVRSTGTGKITINGTGGPGLDCNYGVYVSNAQIAAKDGSMLIVGTSQGTNTSNHGAIFKDNASITSNGLGDISINGTGGNGVDNNYGIQLDQNAKITSQSGNINLIGTGKGNAYFNVGIVISNGAFVESTGNGVGAAKINLEGTGGGIAGGSNSRDEYGIWLMNSGYVKSYDGAVSIKGIAGNGAGSYNSGIRVDPGTLVQSVGHADLSLTGSGGAGSKDNYGVQLQGGEIHSALGNVSITGIGGNGQQDFNAGIKFDGGSKIQTSSGTVMLNGTGGNGTWDNYGIWVWNGGITTTGGNIYANGTAGGSGSNNMGIRIDNGNTLTTAGSGAINLVGTGGSGTGGNNGIWVPGGKVLSDAGNITLTGNGGGTTGDNSKGIILENSSTVESTGGGDILLTGSKGIYSVGSTISGTNVGLQSANIQGGTVNASGILTLAVDVFDNTTFDHSPQGNGGIIIQPYTAGNPITIGGAGTGLKVTESALNSMTLGTGKVLQIGGAQTGDITVVGAVSQAGRDIVLSSGGNVNLNAALTSKSMGILANGDIHVNAVGSADSMILTANGDIYLNTPVNMSGAVQLKGSSGDNNFHIGGASMDGQSTIDVKGVGGQDSVYVQDATNVNNGDYTINQSAIYRSSNGNNTTISYMGVRQVILKAGVGKVNTVTTQILPGVDQVLSGGNSAQSVLNVDCHGFTPLVTAAKIQLNGYGTIFYDGFKSITLTNVPPAPTLTPKGSTESSGSIPYPEPENQAERRSDKKEGKLEFVASKDVNKKRKADGTILVVDEGIRTAEDEK